MHADVVTVALERLGRGAVDKLAVEVVVFEYLAELLRTPLGNEELQTRAIAQATVAVVTEDAAHARPYLGNLVLWDPGAETLGEHRVGGETATDPNVETGAVLWVIDTDKGDVLDLVGDVETRGTGNCGLKLTR